MRGDRCFPTKTQLPYLSKQFSGRPPIALVRITFHIALRSSDAARMSALGAYRFIRQVMGSRPNAFASCRPRDLATGEFDLARQYAYAEPVLSGKYVIELTREYETNARRVAEDQISQPRSWLT